MLVRCMHGRLCACMLTHARVQPAACRHHARPPRMQLLSKCIKPIYFCCVLKLCALIWALAVVHELATAAPVQNPAARSTPPAHFA
jgi:hypothetical protein